MRHVDFSPFYRSTVGFDRLFTMLDSLATPEGVQTYPPYNIARTGDDTYRISMAVAGFSDKEISLEAHRRVRPIGGASSRERECSKA
jgi:molecular chaperone IbpA